jgi:hypothetical protein
MTFVESARQYVQETENPAERAIYDYLLANAVGHGNAKSWGTIQAALRRRGVSMRQNDFQQTILKQSRSQNSEIFIGSSNNGYFLINTTADAEIMREFYQTRIDSEQVNLNRLLELIAEDE